MKHKCPCASRQRLRVGATSKIVAKRRTALVAKVEELLLPFAPMTVDHIVGLNESWKHRMSGDSLLTTTVDSTRQVYSTQRGFMSRELLEEQYIKQ